MGPWNADQVGEETAQWVVFVQVGDAASSNLRLIEQGMRRAAALRGHIVSVWCPCLLHILHREVLSVAWTSRKQRHVSTDPKAPRKQCPQASSVSGQVSYRCSDSAFAS